ncbi:hypothetical protein COOONC_13887 [Cooperia oncophora]
MQRHMIEHTDDVLLRYHPKSPRGLLCPFCRKCTYGYKTMSGLRRHLITPPIQHCQLKRIFEIARSNCRSSLLDPVTKWSSWTDRNVYLAYHGCEPPPRTPRKRPDSKPSAEDPSEHSNTPSPGVLHNSSSTNNAVQPSQSASCSDVTTLSTTPKSVESETPRITPASSASVFITPPGNDSRSLPARPHHDSRKTTHQNPRRPLIFPSPVKRDSAGNVKPSKTLLRPVLQLRKPLLPEDVTQKGSSGTNAEAQSQNVEQNNTSDEKCRSVAKIILKATSTPHHTLVDALNLISADGDEGNSLIADPALAKPLFSSGDVAQELGNVSVPILPGPRSSKTRRQLESVEARIRIFGDCSRVEVPSGYTAVETHSGVRLVSLLLRLESFKALLKFDYRNAFYLFVLLFFLTICCPKFQMSLAPDIKDLFFLDRVPSIYTKALLLAYLPIGCAVFLIRLFIGVHAFFVACLLRKSTIARSIVLRVMCAVLGIVVRSDGKRSSKVNIICANHVSALDHLAVDLVESCVLPSVWDIPSIIRWCFGYVDLGARSGRDELVRRARLHVENENLPLLSFPEGAITSGHKGLLKFNSWPCEVSDQVQPLAMRISRPFFNITPSLLGSTWWADVAWFVFLPVSVYHLTWLPVLQRREHETVEEFSLRVETAIAEYLGLVVTNLTHVDAVEAAKRHLHSRAAPTPVKRRVVNTRVLDEIAMRIKQSHPSADLLDIRMDLERTRDQQATVDRIRSGGLRSSPRLSENVSSDASQWKRMYTERKWTMIEHNRQRYLQRLNNFIGVDSH